MNDALATHSRKDDARGRESAPGRLICGLKLESKIEDVTNGSMGVGGIRFVL